MNKKRFKKKIRDAKFLKKVGILLFLIENIHS